MTIHKLDLLENAVDSFNEALTQYQKAEQGDKRAYKFAILHFAHFLELLFKHYVTKAHPLLIYKNPFAKSLHQQQTIGLWEAVQFLRNEGKEISSDFLKDIEWLKELRNQIEHHKFEMDIEAAELTLGRLTKALQEFNEFFGDFDIASHVEAKNLQIFEALSYQYREKIKLAQRKAKELSETGDADTCYDCFNETAAFINGQWTCQYCEATDQTVECCVCGEDVRQILASIWNDDSPEVVDYICRGCREGIENK